MKGYITKRVSVVCSRVCMQSYEMEGSRAGISILAARLRQLGWRTEGGKWVCPNHPKAKAR